MTACWLGSLTLLGGASMALIRAGNVGSAGAASCGPQIMLYVSLPLESRGSSSLPRYGLRIGEFRKRPTTPQLVAIAPTPTRADRSPDRVSFGRSYHIRKALSLECHAPGVWPAIQPGGPDNRSSDQGHQAFGPGESASLGSRNHRNERVGGQSDPKAAG
jgi:hypothetical protein